MQESEYGHLCHPFPVSSRDAVPMTVSPVCLRGSYPRIVAATSGIQEALKIKLADHMQERKTVYLQTGNSVNQDQLRSSCSIFCGCWDSYRCILTLRDSLVL